MDETIEEAARRELMEETGLKHIYMEQFRVFSALRRDPRERVVTVAFIALVRPSDYELIAGDDASAAMWFQEDALPPMAFDHTEIIREAREHLGEVLRIKPVAFELLNKVFSLSELQKVYEAINRTRYDRRNFQRKALQTGMLEEVMFPNAPFASMKSSRHHDDDIGVDKMCSSILEDSVSECSSSRPRERRSSTGRPALKLFSFRSAGKKRSDDDNDDKKEDASIKDIFDF